MGYVCRCLIVLVILGNSGQLQAGQEVSLPDYQRESRIVYQGLCDRGSVNYKTYWKKGRVCSRSRSHRCSRCVLHVEAPYGRQSWLARALFYTAS